MPARAPRPPEEATRACLSIVAEFTGWPIAHAYGRLPDASDGTRGAMTSMRVWHLAPSGDARRTDAFVAASEKAVFALNQGFVGRVAASGEPVSCEDCTVLPGFVRAGTARENGVRGCFMFPLRVGDGVAIVLEFFSRETGELKPDLLALMAYVADRLALRMSGATAEIATQIEHLRQGAARSTESLSRVRGEIGTVQGTAIDIIRVSGAH